MTNSYDFQPIAVRDRAGRGVVRVPHDARRMMLGAMPDDREAFVALYLDSRHAPCAEPYTVHIGALNYSLVHPREVFAPAIAARACTLLVAHNHPSGSLTPSADDIELHKRLYEAGEILGVKLLDALILSHHSEKLYSAREAGDL